MNGPIPGNVKLNPIITSLRILGNYLIDNQPPCPACSPCRIFRAAIRYIQTSHLGKQANE